LIVSVIKLTTPGHIVGEYKHTRSDRDNLTLSVGNLHLKSAALYGKNDVHAAIQKLDVGMSIAISKFKKDSDERAKLLNVLQKGLISIFNKEVLEKSAQTADEHTAKANIAEHIAHVLHKHGINTEMEQTVAKTAVKYILAPIGVTLRLIDGAAAQNSKTKVPISHVIDHALYVANNSNLDEHQTIKNLKEVIGSKVGQHVDKNYSVEDLLRIRDVDLNEILLPKFEL